MRTAAYLSAIEKIFKIYFTAGFTLWLRLETYYDLKYNRICRPKFIFKSNQTLRLFGFLVFSLWLYIRLSTFLYFSSIISPFTKFSILFYEVCRFSTLLLHLIFVLISTCAQHSWAWRHSFILLHLHKACTSTFLFKIAIHSINGLWNSISMLAATLILSLMFIIFLSTSS